MPDLKPFIVAGLALGSVYSLSGVGLTVLYRTTGVINLAYGATGALGALVAWGLLEAGNPELLAWAAGIGTATAITVAYGVLIAPLLAARDATVNLAATLGLALVILGFVLLAWNDEPRLFGLPTDEWSFTVVGVNVIATKVLALVLALAITVAVAVLLKRTRVGLSMRALAEDRELGGMQGMRVTRLGAAAWALTGVLSGVSGLLVADLIRLEAATLTFLVVPGIAAAIIGGLNSLPLTLAGGLCIGLAESVMTPFVEVTNYRGAAPFVIAIVFLLWQQRRRTGAVVVPVAR